MSGWKFCNSFHGSSSLPRKPPDAKENRITIKTTKKALKEWSRFLRVSGWPNFPIRLWPFGGRPKFLNFDLTFHGRHSWMRSQLKSVSKSRISISVFGSFEHVACRRTSIRVLILVTLRFHEPITLWVERLSSLATSNIHVAGISWPTFRWPR